jgi:uncharacterized membrane protein YqaE (UPF0057 family)
MKKTLRIVILSVFMFSQTASSYASFGKKSKENETVVNPNEVKSVPSVDAVNSAMEEFKNLSRHEKKERFKDLKKAVKELKEAKKAGAEPETNTILLAILAILLPPLAVYLHQGEINTKFWISLILTLLFFLPGVIYALLVIFGGA